MKLYRRTNPLGSPRPRRRDRRLRLSGRRHPAGLRRDARLPDSAHPGPARAGRHPHGRRLRARQRPRRRRDCHVGARRDQHGHRHRDRDDGLVADRLHHRPGRQQADWIGRVPGNRHHRHHVADHQAQLPRDQRGGRRAGRARGVRGREIGPSRPGARGHHQGRAAGQLRGRLGRRRTAADRGLRLGAAGRRRSARRARVDQLRRAAADSRRPRRHAVRRREGDHRARRARSDSDCRDAARHWRRRRVASAQPRDDGHARRGMGQPRDPGSRSADRARHAFRRSRDRQSEDLRADGSEDPRRHRSRRVEQERPRRRGDRQGPARRARGMAPARRAPRSLSVDRAHRGEQRAKSPFATSRTCPTTVICTPRT